MLKLHSIFKSGTKISKESSPHIKTTEKSIEGLNKNRNISLDFSNTPLKQNKKIIKRNTRTNSFNSLIINQTESGIYPQYPFMSGFNPTYNYNLLINKNFSRKKKYNQQNKSITLKKGIINLNKPKLPISKKNSKKKSKRNFLNSYFINPSNIHISFNTVGNNFQFEPNLKQNKNNNNILKTDFFHNNLTNNKAINNSEINKSIHILHKAKSNKKYNFNNEINNLINNISEENQKLLLNEIKLFLSIFTKIKKNKNEEIIINENDIPELKKGGLLGHILNENYKIKRKNEELELKIENISKELEQMKKEKINIKNELENKDIQIKEMNLKINTINQDFINLRNTLNNTNKKKDKEKDKILDEYNSIKSSYNDLDNISLDNNANIDIEAYKSALNKNNIKKMAKNKSEKNVKTKNKVVGLNFGSKVGTYNFNDEFLKDYENFSESWRKEVDKMIQRRKIKKNVPNINLNNDNKNNNK